MVKKFFKFFGMALAVVIMADAIVYAQTADTEPTSPETATFKSRCAEGNIPDGFPPCATSPAECASGFFTIDDEGGANGLTRKNIVNTPFNCLYLQEPIGGKPGYDLYKAVPHMDSGEVYYELWHGEALVGDEQGPFQAILAFEEGKESQGPFGLLYNYLGLVYNFLSGIIIGFVVLIAIVGGIRMTTSAGNQEAFGAGRSMIIRALIGMALWFTASIILYTINPTFFAF